MSICSEHFSFHTADASGVLELMTVWSGLVPFMGRMEAVVGDNGFAVGANVQKWFSIRGKQAL